jgi:hypothetical protein
MAGVKSCYGRKDSVRAQMELYLAMLFRTLVPLVYYYLQYILVSTISVRSMGRRLQFTKRLVRQPLLKRTTYAFGLRSA